MARPGRGADASWRSVQADSLYSDPHLAQFYDIENGWAEDLEYCKNLAVGCASVLDLGCGTGLLAASLARQDGCEAVGVDPAEAMLSIAARRSGGERAQWIQGDARNIRLNRRFDLVVLTGHAFQVFLTDEDRASVLRTIASHLKPEGRFVFDCRNPEVEAWKNWTPAKSTRQIEHPTLGRVVAWNDVSHDADGGIVTYGTYYKVVANDRLYSSQSKIAFPSQDQLSALISDAKLAVQTWLGDWSGAPYTPLASQIIPVGRRLTANRI
jgi:ubiquinone/menaquinone biosynthesis C-methylase UbiE